MKKNPHYGLKAFVYGVLLQRIIIITLIIAIISAFAVYMIQREAVYDLVLERASQSIKRFNAEIFENLESGNIENYNIKKKFNVLLSSKRVDRNGSFVYAKLYDHSGNVVSESIDSEYEYIDLIYKAMKYSEKSFPGLDEYWQSSFRVADLPHIEIVLPLVNQKHQVVAFVYGVYGVSEYAMEQINKRISRIIIFVILIVIATSLILYPVILNLTKKLVNYSQDLLSSNLETIRVLGSAIAKRDSDTDAHNYRVTIYAIHLARNFGLEDTVIKSLIKGAFLHDVGKIGIHDKVLLKPGKLDEKEFDVMKTHVEHGVDIISSSNWLGDAKTVVHGHHEKYDGSGYPRGLKGNMIPIEARIFAIVDVFDALTSERPYKAPFSYDKTIEILRNDAGTHFDPSLVDAFCEISKELYEKFSGREDGKLKDELQVLIEKYFYSNIDALKY